VEAVVSNLDKDNLVTNILGQQPETFDIEPVAREPVPGARLRTRAFIKVQDGCDNRCTFCVTTIARGAGRSRSIEDVLADIRAAIDGGSKEVVLTGVHLGSWGHDFETPSHLSELVRAILADTDAPRLRLSSLEPWDLSPGFFQLWEDPRLARHIHLPLQSGSRATLRRMARKTTPETFAGLVDNARQVMPDMAITTDVITGFPGETESEYAESLEFVNRMRFAGGHVFTYSERKGTAAAGMPDPVLHSARKERNARMREVLNASALAYCQRFVGSRTDVLWETAELLGPQTWTLSGLSDNYLRVRAEAPRQMWNQITPVYLTGVADGGMTGRVI
jgi:threonylcarbamoyladenosine tRNA methylthiotransferase MtaB